MANQANTLTNSQSKTDYLILSQPVLTSQSSEIMPNLNIGINDAFIIPLDQQLVYYF